MAAGEQTLNVKITGDSAGLTKAVNTAATSMEGLQKQADKLDAADVSVNVGVNDGGAQRNIDSLSASVDKLDGEGIEIPANLELSRINRDQANLQKVLDGIERRKADPNVGLDLVQLNKDEAKVRKAIDDLDKRKVIIETDVDSTGMSKLSGLRNVVGGLREGFEGGGGSGAGLVGGLSAAARGMSAVGAEGAAAATGVGALVVALAGAAKVAWNLGENAADVETSVSQLSALVGSKDLGAKTFADLQKWAAATPFAIDDATEATKKLVAAGVPLKDIPDYLHDIGNVAAATGVPLDQIAVVFAQMESSGKASYENLQQLAEAGIPVWNTLSKKLKIPVADLQKMATNGKLGADAIDLVRESLNQMYPTAMQQQAATFNGQMSTLNDNLDQTKQTLGIFVLPAMSDAVGLFNQFAGAVLAGSKQLIVWNNELRQNMHGVGLLEILSPSIGLMEILAGKLNKGSTAMGGFSDTTNQALASVQQSLQDANENVDELKKGLQNAIEALGTIGVDVRAHVSFIISRAQLEREIKKATTGKKAVQLPSHLNITQIKGLGDKQFQVIETLSSWAEQGLQRGAEKLKIDPDFDIQAYYRKLRKQLRPLVIQAGIDPKDADRVMTKILGVPRAVKIKPEIQNYEEYKNKLYPPTIKPVVDLGAARDDIGQLTSPKQVDVHAKADTKNANNELNMTAAGRNAWIKALTSNVGETERILNLLARDRTVHVKVHTDFDTTGGTGRPNTSGGRRSLMIAPQLAPTGTPTGGAAGPSLLSAAQAMTDAPWFSSRSMLQTVVVAPAPTARPAPVPERLRPSQTPVQVVLDGAVIADHLQGHAKRLFVADSVRRVP